MQPEQKELFDVLAQQQQLIQQVDRIFTITAPIAAFLLCVICANFNWQSTLGTFLMLWIAFYAVSIKRMNIYVWLTIIVIYSLVDIYFSYGTIPSNALGRQLGTMLTFTAILGFGRPYIDQWYIKSNQH